MDKTKMTRQDLAAYRARWKRVNEFHLKEIRRMSLAEKLKEANLLYRTARSMKLRSRINDPEIVAARKRWLKLIKAYESTKGT